jgi:HAE1 family hydrophobic/amphiphilic exporter-1
LGEFLSVMPLAISATLISSLFVAIIVIPTLISRWLKLKPKDNGTQHHRNKKRHDFVRTGRAWLTDHYVGLLRNVLPSKKKRRLMLGGAWMLFVLSILVPATGLMKIEMFSSVDIDYFIININLPPGSNLEQTKLVTEQVENVIKKLPELDNYVTNIGSSLSLDVGGGGAAATHLANLTVNLVDDSERDRKSFEITEAIRPDIEKIQGAEIRVEELSAGPPTGAPIEVRINGADLNQLALLSQDIQSYFKDVPGVINIRDTLEESTGDFTFTVDKQQANFYGLDIITIASTLRNAIFGVEASSVTIDGDDIDITVKYNENEFNDASDLKNILLFTPSGQNIPLKQVADLNLEPSLLSISHRNGERSVIVRANIEEGVNLQKVQKGFAEFTENDLSVPMNYSVDVGGEVEDIDQSFRETFLSMIVAVILIAFILVLQFNSFKQPFIIIFILPLAIIGVIIGLNILRMPFSFTAFIGIVALSGIVVNDAIVLIDRINKNIKYGKEFVESIIEAGIARMQPIFLTTLTTVAGVFPLVFADELWRGLAVTIIFGLTFSTILTLVMVPIQYAGFCRKEKCVDVY